MAFPSAGTNYSGNGNAGGGRSISRAACVVEAEEEEEGEEEEEEENEEEEEEGRREGRRTSCNTSRRRHEKSKGIRTGTTQRFGWESLQTQAYTRTAVGYQPPMRDGFRLAGINSRPSRAISPGHTTKVTRGHRCTHKRWHGAALRES